MNAADIRVGTVLLDSPRTLVGERAADVAPQVVRAAAPTTAPRVILVAGSGFEHRVWADPLLAAFRGFPLRTVVHAGLPTPESVARLAREIRAHRADVVVTVGGGSVMDAGKAAAALSITDPTPDAVVLACARETDAPGAPPVLALPTTPGTGAEATPFATIWHRARGRKLSLRGAALRPVAAVLDPDLLLGLPAPTLLSCLLDTLAQGIEGAWSIRADARSQELGAAAWAQLAEVLEQRDGDLSAAHRRAALLAGHLAGRAIAIAGTTVCHAMSYPLTLHYGLAHGHACGLTLAAVLRYNAAVGADCADPRGPGRVRAAIAEVVRSAGADSVEELAAKVQALVRSPALPPAPRLRHEASRIATEALAYDRAGNNPRHVDVAALTQLLAGSAERDHAR